MTGQPPPYYSPPGNWNYPGVPKPRRDEERLLTIVVITIAIVVVVAAVTTAVLYLMVSNLIGGYTPPLRPYVGLSTPVEDGVSSNRTVNITVTAASDPITSFPSFKGQISMDGTPLTGVGVTLQAGDIITFGTAVRLIIRDFGGEGKLNSGDTFHIYGMNGTHAWSFSLIWAPDGGLITTSQWNTS